jgi:hypothetical protein
VKSMKTRIAAGATILGLGGLTGLALSAGHQRAAQPVATKPLVRTKVIRRTIHVTKHAKPKHPVGAAPGASASGGGSTSAPVVTHTSGAGGGSSTPVTTATSGAGGGEIEHESEGGHEGEGADD